MCENLGLASATFVDFGEDFQCRDTDGENDRTAIVSSIVADEKDGRAVVSTHEGSRHGFQDGDHVQFREVSGVTFCRKSCLQVEKFH
jgi:hypothetical protein